MSTFKKLASDTAVYGLSSVLGRLMNYLLFPIHTYAFPGADYGLISVYYAWSGLLFVFFTFGMETAFFRFYMKKGTDKIRVYRLIMSFLVVFTGLFGGLLLFTAGDFSDQLFDHPQAALFSRFLIVLLMIDSLSLIPFAKLRADNRPLRFAGSKLGIIGLTVLLNLFFLYLLKDAGPDGFLGLVYDPEIGPGYILLANLLANALGIPLLFQEISVFRFRWDWEKFWPILRYAYPILFTGAAAVTNEVIDRILLQHLLGEDGLEAAGIYSACYKFAIFISLTVQAFKFAAEPLFFAKATDRDSPELFAGILKYFVVVLGLMFLAVSMNLPWLKFITAEEYRAGLGIVPILLGANVFLGIYYNLAVWFKITDRTYFGAIIGLSGAALTIVLNYLLIPLLGYYGSAWTTFCCYFLMAGMCRFFGRKYFPVPYDSPSIFFYLGLAAGLFFLSNQIDLENQILQTVFGNLLIISYLIIFYFREKKEIRLILAGEKF